MNMKISCERIIINATPADSLRTFKHAYILKKECVQKFKIKKIKI